MHLLAKDIVKTFGAKLIEFGIGGFGHTVGKHHQRVALFQLEGLFLIF